mgnify:CR=1 FL=1
MSNKEKLINQFISDISYFKNTFFKTMTESITFYFNDYACDEAALEKAKSIIFFRIAKEKNIKVYEIKELSLSDEEWEDIRDEQYSIKCDLLENIDSEEYDLSLKDYLYTSVDIYTLKTKVDEIIEKFENLKKSGINTLLLENDFLDLKEYFEGYLIFLRHIYFEEKINEFLESYYIESINFNETREEKIDFSFEIFKTKIFDIFRNIEFYTDRIKKEIEAL